MPVDLEMFLSHTRASHFHYPHFAGNHFSFENSYEDDGFIKSYSFSKNHIFIPNNPKEMAFLKKKNDLEFCKIDKDFDTCKKTYGNFTDVSRKKKVSFADDKGFSLVEIREIPGSPTWSSGGTVKNFMCNNQQIAVPKKRWKLAFESPPWTDSKLIDLLEINKVVLQSISINTDNTLKRSQKCFDHFFEVLKTISQVNSSDDIKLQGTVKVKNLAYEKNVFVRISFDRWLSSIDVKANYLKPENCDEKHNNYDSFFFSIDIPKSSFKYEVIEFCIGFQCKWETYWDNNGGVNYRLTTEIVKKSDIPVYRPNKKLSNDSITLSLTENIERFSEIDSWNNFMRNQPYW